MDSKPAGQMKLSAKQRELLERRLLERAKPEAKRTGIPRRPQSETAPLSFAQQRLWFLNILEPEGSQYHHGLAQRLVGKLNQEALRGALKLVVDRHESLRTTIHTVDGAGHQKVNNDLVMDCPLTDLSHLPDAEREEAKNAWLEGVLSRPFDLAKDLMLRAELCRLSDEEHVLFLVIHHISSDAWSMDVLLRELAAAYTALIAGQEPQLPELAIQYPDFAVWQREWFSGPVLQKQLEYWRKQLDGAPPTLELPADAPRHTVTSARSGTAVALLPAKELQILEELSRSEESSLFMTLLASFELLMAKLTGRTDVVVGSPIAGRNREEVENLIGFFVNTLVLRQDLSGNPSFRDLVRRVREVTLEGYANQDLPFEKLVEELQPERSMHRTPLFQVFFNMINISGGKLQLPGLTAETIPNPDTDSKFELTLYTIPRPDGLRLIASYNADLFTEARIEEMLAQYVQLLTQAAANPDQPIGSFTLVTDTARKSLPDPAASLSTQTGLPVHVRMSAQAAKSPGRVAVSDPTSSWTYGELEACSNQLAHRLIASGIQKGDLVGIYAHRSAALVAAMLGTLKAGGAFLILDPAQPASRLIDCVKIARPIALLELDAAEPMAAPLAEFVAGAIDASRRIRIPSNSAAKAFLAEQPADLPHVEIGPRDKAYIAFTSGSTGTPKGILGSHGPLGHFLDWHTRTFALTEADRFSMLSGLGHDPLLRDIFTPLSIGATIVIPNSDDIGSDRLGEWMEREKISISHLTPAMGQVLAGSRDGASKVNATSVRWLFFGGDRLTEQDLERAKSWAPAAECVNFYGATETPQAVGWNHASRGGRRGESIPVGTGIDDVQLLVLNSAGQLCGIGEVGTIHVRTPHLADGYVNDDAQTAARFIVNPLSSNSADRLYATGDLGRYGLDGSVEFLGRNDDQVKIRGYRVELAEIESALRSHDQVGNSLLIVSDGPTGERRLIAYVVPRGSEQPTTRDLRTYLKERLPEFMIPSAFVMLEQIPLTPNGKINRAALPAPESDQREAASTDGAGLPQSEAELLIAGIWRDLLHVETITVYDNFLDLGGHSLLGMEVLSRIRKGADVIIKPRELMFQTLGQIAALCDERKQVAQPVQRGGAEQLEPVRFGSPSNDLYGCHHPPIGRSDRTCGILLCQPHGPEYLRSHRAIRQLAGRLCRAGFPVFRFDYFGCGDSFGDDDDGNIARWTCDVNAAVAELKHHAQVDRVIAVGLRLGGALAALAGAEKGGIDAMALWDPVVIGRQHLDELQSRHAKQLEFLPKSAAEASSATAVLGEMTEILGFELGAPLRDSLKTLDLKTLNRAPARRMLVIESTADPSTGELAARLQSLGVQLDQQHLPDHEIWMAAPDKAVVPGQILQSIVDWVTRNAT